MVAPVVVGLGRAVVGFAKSPAGKQFLKRLKDAGKSPAERKALLTEQIQKSFRDSPGIRQRLIALEKGEIEELSKAEILAKKIAERKAGKKEAPYKDFTQKTGYVKPKPNEEVLKWDSFKGMGYIHEPTAAKGGSGPRPRKFALTAKGKKALQKAIDSGTVGRMNKQDQAAVAKLLSEGKLKSRPIVSTSGEMGTRTAETQLGLFPGEDTVIRTAPKVISEKAPVSVTKVGMLRKSINNNNNKIEKLKLKLADDTLSDTDKYNITQQLQKAYAKEDKLQNELVALRGQRSLFGEKAGDEFSEASAVAGAKRQLERERLKRKRMEEAWTREKELKTIEENAAAVRADIQKDPRRLPKDVYKEPYNPQEYGFEGYNPGYRGEPRAGSAAVYGAGKKASRETFISPKPSATVGGTGRSELPEYALEAEMPAGKYVQRRRGNAPIGTGSELEEISKIERARGAAPVFAKELTGRQTRRSMGAITPEDDILAGVPYSLNPQGKLKYAYPKTGDIKTSTVTKTREWDSVSGKMRDIPKGSPEYGKTEVLWAGRTGAPRDRVSSQTGLTFDEFDALSDLQKNELNRRLQLTKAGGARISEPATGFKIPPELTQTGMTQAEYAGLAGARSRGMTWGEQRGALDRAQGRILERTTPGAAARLDKTGRKTILGDGTEMNTAEFRKLPPMKRLGMLDKSFATASPKGQGFKSLTKQQERLDEIKKPKEWWDTDAPDKPLDYTKSYFGQTKGQARRKAKRELKEFMGKALELSPKEYAKLKPTERNALYTFVREFPGGPKKAADAIIKGASKEGEVEVGQLLNMLRESGFLRATPNLIAPFKKGGSVDKKWIQKVRSRIEKKGTEGVCTGEKYGSSSCPPGSKRYNLATTFKNMNRKRA